MQRVELNFLIANHQQLHTFLRLFANAGGEARFWPNIRSTTEAEGGMLHCIVDIDGLGSDLFHQMDFQSLVVDTLRRASTAPGTSAGEKQFVNFIHKSKTDVRELKINGTAIEALPPVTEAPPQDDPPTGPGATQPVDLRGKLLAAEIDRVCATIRTEEHGLIAVRARRMDLQDFLRSLLSGLKNTELRAFSAGFGGGKPYWEMDPDSLARLFISLGESAKDAVGFSF